MEACALLLNAAHSAPKRPIVPQFGEINSRLRSRPAQIQSQTKTTNRNRLTPIYRFWVLVLVCVWSGCGFVYFEILRNITTIKHKNE